MSDLLDSLIDPRRIEYNHRRREALRAIAKDLGLIDWDIPVVTITGTNGKGSTVAGLNRIYREAGYRVGVFTSPHLLSVHERIQINDTLISEADLHQLTEVLKGHPEFSFLSWFEAFFLLALMHFRQHDLDLLILEVGMGGRLDATNIIDADMVIVTNVDLDHQAFLGHTREEIAFEKAGLFRLQKPVVFADENCPKAIQQHAQSLKAPLYSKSLDYDYHETLQGFDLRIFENHFQFNEIPHIHLAAMSSAIFASYCLNPLLPVTRMHWEAAIHTVFIPGRFQKIQGNNQPLMILDVGHNPHAANNLVQRLKNLEISGKIHMIFSILQDKDRKNTVNILKKLDILWYPCVLNCERASTLESLQECFDAHTIHATPIQALKKAREHAKLNDVIVAFGSFHLIEPLMRLLLEEGCDVF